MCLRQASAILTAICFLALPVFAEDIPQTISYQGKLVGANGIPVNGEVPMEFGIYNVATGGTRIWPESAPELHDSVAVIQGLYNVWIGSATPGGIDLPFDEAYWLEVIVDSETLSPRQKITAVGYSLNSVAGGGVGDGHSLDAFDWEPEDALFVDEEGNVGIGTTSPAAMLDVSCTGVVGLRVFTLRNTNVDHGLTNWPTDSYLLMGYQGTGVGGGYIEGANDDGGMGTGPGFVVHGVHGTTDAADGTPALALVGSKKSGTGDAYGVLDANETVLQVRNGHIHTGSNLATFKGSGNVGIGTDDPQYKLDVEGTVQAHAFDTGDIVFRKDGKAVWRMFEDEKYLYLEQLTTGKVSRIFLEDDIEALVEERTKALVEERTTALERRTTALTEEIAELKSSLKEILAELR